MKSIEISVILIIILLIFGVMLTAVENSTEKAIKATETNNMEKLISEVVDNLINNPGVPENWNEYGEGTPGLAIVNDDGKIIPNSVSYSKLIALGKDYDKFVYEKLFTSKIHSSMELHPQETSISSVKIGENEIGESVFSITRLVKCDFYKGYAIKDFQNGKCNRHHNQNGYGCNYFKIFKSNLKESDYYLLTDNSETYDLSYIIETTRNDEDESWKTLMSNKIYLNDEIDFYNDTSAVAFVHLDKAHPKAVIVSVPKNFDEKFLVYDYFTTKDCEFIVKAWY